MVIAPGGVNSQALDPSLVCSLFTKSGESGTSQAFQSRERARPLPREGRMVSAALFTCSVMPSFIHSVFTQGLGGACYVPSAMRHPKDPAANKRRDNNICCRVVLVLMGPRGL